MKRLLSSLAFLLYSPVVFGQAEQTRENPSDLIFLILFIGLGLLLVALLLKISKQRKLTRFLEKRLKKTEEENSDLKAGREKAAQRGAELEADKKQMRNKLESVQRFFENAPRGVDMNTLLDNHLKPLFQNIEVLFFERNTGEKDLQLQKLKITLNKRKLRSLENPTIIGQDPADQAFQEDIPFNIAILPIKASENNTGFLIAAFEKGHMPGKGEMALLKGVAEYIAALNARSLYQHYQERFQKNLILYLVRILELYDESTKGHSERVAKLSVAVAEKLKFERNVIVKTYWASLVHDIGKLLLPMTILYKKGRMTATEFEIFKEHPDIGRKILKTSDEMSEIAEIVGHHHERYDGRGYPGGLRGKTIPVISRIIAIADAYDNLIHKGYDKEESLERLQSSSGAAFDPELLVLFFEVIEERVDN